MEHLCLSVGKVHIFDLKHSLTSFPEIGGTDDGPTHTVEDNLLLGAYIEKSKASVKASMEEMFTRFPRLTGRKSSVPHWPSALPKRW